MPLLKEWETDTHSLAAIWRIGEPEHFFREQTGIFPEIKSEKRRLERLAGRFLLQYLKEDFPLHHIYADEHDKPRIPKDQYRFSISHSYPFVAVVVSDRFECGIDIQTWHPRMSLLQHKFLSPREQGYFLEDTRLLTLAWSAKEAAFKWQGRRGVDFKKQLPLKNFVHLEEGFELMVLAEHGGVEQSIHLQSIVNEEFAIAWVVNDLVS